MVAIYIILGILLIFALITLYCSIVAAKRGDIMIEELNKKKRVVRKNVFETNSSSMHSILITKNDVNVTLEEMEGDWCNPERIYINSKGVWELRDTREGFGRWPFKILMTFADKFRYALCEFLAYVDPVSDRFKDEYDLMKLIARDINPRIQDIRPDTGFVYVYKDPDGKQFSDAFRWVETVNEDTDDEYYVLKGDKDVEVEYVSQERIPAIGSIDHQSAGLLRNFLVDHNITLKEFLMNKKYVIVIDSDELCEWQDYKASGFINMDFIVEEYGKSGEDPEYRKWLEEQKNASGTE